MKLAETRRTNLRALAEIHGSAKLSVLLGYRQPSFLSQMIGPNPTREVTEKSARDYEVKMGLPDGYLDRPLFPATQQVAPADAVSVPPGCGDGGGDSDVQRAITLAADTIALAGVLIQRENVTLTPAQFAKLIAIEILDAAERDYKPREAHLKQLLEFIK